MLKNKTVILGITGSIAAYKMANVASMLVKQGCDVHVIMTKNATNFINPITFESLTNNKCLVDTFDRNFQFNIAHISLAKKADVMLIAPASANVIAKLAYGMADDMLTTTALACTCKKLVAPAMNTAMYRNQIVQDNLTKLKDYGFTVINPVKGMLACKDVGEGKLPEEELLFNYIIREIAYPKDMSGLNVLVTAGPTIEPIDPVRYLTNHSTGKMGYALAKICMLRGADVTLITGKTNLRPPSFVNTIEITTALEMFEAVRNNFGHQNIIIKSAAVADYRPKVTFKDKVKKSETDMTIELERNPDILHFLGQNRKPGQYICGFSMETENMLENSKKKLLKKNIDMIVANNLKEQGAGFGVDTNIVTIITVDSNTQLDIMSKEQVALKIADSILENMK